MTPLMRLLAVLVLVAAVHQHPQIGVPVLVAGVVGFAAGFRTAIRKTGVGMVRAGTHRVLTGKL